MWRRALLYSGLATVKTKVGFSGRSQGGGAKEGGQGGKEARRQGGKEAGQNGRNPSRHHNTTWALPFSNGSLGQPCLSVLVRRGGRVGLASIKGAGAMAIQSVVVVGLILLSGTLAVHLARHGVLDREGWIVANAVVMLAGALALAFDLAWAAWLTAALFALLVVFPLALFNRAGAAAQRGQWHKAARLHKWAVILHPSPWARLGLKLRLAHSTDGTAGYVAALREIEATGSTQQKAFARLMLAQEQRDWNGLLMLARADNVGFSEAKPREIRALGELGRLDEMVRIYEDAERRLLPPSRQECRLFVFAFAGRVAAVQQLLNGALSALDDDAKAYWTAVAQLRVDRQDEVARGMLRRLAESGASEGVRRSAAQQLRQTDLAGAPTPSHSEDTERIVERMLQNSSPNVRGQQNRRPLFEANTKSHIRGVLLLVLIVLLALLQRYYF
jgi:hypothetical protein